MSKRTNTAADGEADSIGGDTANAARGSTPPVVVKLRYLGPPAEGIHPVVGGVKAGGFYAVAASDAEAVLSGGGFERVSE